MPRLLLIYLFVLIKVQGYVPYLPTHDANSSLINVSINLNFNGLNNCNFLPLKSSSYFFSVKGYRQNKPLRLSDCGKRRRCLSLYYSGL